MMNDGAENAAEENAAEVPTASIGPFKYILSERNFLEVNIIYQSRLGRVL